MPILSSIRRSSVTSWLRLARVRWISMAHCAASNALPNSTRKASPMVLISVPLNPGKISREEPAMFFEQFESELIVALGQRAVAHHVSEHDGGEFPLLCVLGGHSALKQRLPGMKR